MASTFARLEGQLNIKASLVEASYAAYNKSDGYVRQEIGNNITCFAFSGSQDATAFCQTDTKFGVGKINEGNNCFPSMVDGTTRKDSWQPASVHREALRKFLHIWNPNLEQQKLVKTLDVDVKQWATGKEGNLRALLSTLQYAGIFPRYIINSILSHLVHLMLNLQGSATLCLTPGLVTLAHCVEVYVYPFAVPSYMSAFKAFKSPNNNVVVDGMISVIARELVELSHNPLVNAWYVGQDVSAPTVIANLYEGIYGTGGGGSYIGQVQDKTGARFIPQNNTLSFTSSKQRVLCCLRRVAMCFCTTSLQIV